MVADDSYDDRTESFETLSSGTCITHYKIISHLGTGGMGEVYLAEDTALNRKVAIKFLPKQYCKNETSRKRFKREAQAAAQLNHPNIVKIYEVGDFNDQPFYTMELVDGTSLRNLLKTKPVHIYKSIGFIIQLCEALYEAHLSGVIHRDIKPSNIVIDNHDQAILLDFGLAAVKDTKNVTKNGTTLGTLGYMAPEIVIGKDADNRSDIFSIGVTLYELIANIQPFKRDSDAATLHATAYDMPVAIKELMPALPIQLNDIIMKAISKDSKNRYQSVELLISDLKDVHKLIDPDISYRGQSSNPEYRDRGFKKSGIVSVIIVVALIIALIPGTRNKVINLLTRDQLPKQIHLAVLPFTDLTNSESGKILSKGLSELITSNLTQMEQFDQSLLVVPASDMRQREINSAADAYHIFGANLVVSGSVQILDNNIRMTMNLIDSKTIRQLQSSVIDIPAENILAFQDTSIDEVVSLLNLELNSSDKEIIAANTTDNSKAFELYVKGQGYLSTPELINTVDTSILYFREALKIDSAYLPALTGLSQACWKKYTNETNEMYRDLAFYYLEQAKKINKQRPEVYLTSGIFLNETGQFEKAVEDLSYAVAIDSFNRAAYKELGNALVSLNMTDSAETVYKKAIAVKPEHWGGYLKLSQFFITHGEYEKAAEQLEILTAINPQGYDVFNNTGAIYFSLGKVEKALELWERSVEFHPNFGALSNLATVYYLTEDFSKAAENYRKALDLNMLDYRLWFNYGGSLKKLNVGGDRVFEAYNKGIKLAEAQREINPKDCWLLADLSDAYASIDDPKKAIPLIEEALALEPNNIEIKVTAGIVYEITNNRDKALDEIAIALNKGFPIAQLESISELDELLADQRLDSLVHK